MTEDTNFGNLNRETVNLELIRAQSKACVRELEKTFFDNVFEFLPEAREYRNEITEHLTKVALLYSREAFEAFDSVFHKVNKKQLKEHYPAVPAPSSRKEAQARLREELTKHPDAYHSTYAQNYWDDFNRRNLEEKFVFGLYENLKKIFVRHYLDIILNMDSKDLRAFDRKLYRNVTVKYAKAVYRLLKKARSSN